MSSTTGGRDYRPLACYYTDRLVAEAIVRAFVVPVAGEDDTFLEPHVGGGAFLQALYTAGLVRADNVEVQDIDPEAPGLAMPGDHLSTVAPDTGHHLRTGFLADAAAPHFTPTWTLGNPPFGALPPKATCPKCKGSGYAKGLDHERHRIECRKCEGHGTYQPKPDPAAEPHLRAALALGGRHVLFILQAGIYGGLGREALWSSVPLRHSAVLVPRPSYGGRDGDGSGNDSVDHEVFWFDRLYTGPYTRSRLLWEREEYHR